MDDTNYEWDQGSDLVISLNYEVDGLPVDLTNYAMRMDIAPVMGGTVGNPVFSFNSMDFDEDLDIVGETDNEAVMNSQGNIMIRVPRSLTLPGGAVGDILDQQSVYKYDLFLRNLTTDTQSKILQGSITVTRSVTLWA